MDSSASHQAAKAWLCWFPPAQWLANYRACWLTGDFIGGLTLAAYAIPVSLAYSSLAGLPPQVGCTDICWVGSAMLCSGHRDSSPSVLPPRYRS